MISHHAGEQTAFSIGCICKESIKLYLFTKTPGERDRVLTGLLLRWSLARRKTLHCFTLVAWLCGWSWRESHRATHHFYSPRSCLQGRQPRIRSFAIPLCTGGEHPPGITPAPGVVLLQTAISDSSSQQMVGTGFFPQVILYPGATP